MGTIFTRHSSPVRYKLVETIPASISLPSPHMSTYDCFSTILSSTKRRLCIVSFCCNLRSTPEGAIILRRILELARDGIKIDILVDEKSRDADIDQFRSPNIQYRKVDMGLIHDVQSCLLSSFWVADSCMLYIGSASLTGGSISTIKTLGVYSDNKSLATDLMRRFTNYYYISEEKCLCFMRPITKFHIDRTNSGCFFSDSPSSLLGFSRTLDSDAILDHLSNAQRSIDMEVLSLTPLIRKDDTITYWPLLHDAVLKAAVERGVKIRILIGIWSRSDAFAMATAKSLNNLGVGHADISVRTISFSKKNTDDINNTKFLVVDDARVYITSANMDGTHHSQHAFVSFNCINTNLAEMVGRVFERDWQSKYSEAIV